MKHFEYAIIGAGVAGLGAAYKLKKLNKPYIVLEQNSFAGGRTNTKVLDNDIVMTTGAGFLMNSYSNVFKILKELNLNPEPIDKMSVEVFKDSKYYALLSKDPSTSIFTGLVSLKTKIKMLLFFIKYLGIILKADMKDMFKLSYLDTESAYSVAKEEISKEFADYLLDPIVFSLFSYSSKDISKVFIFNALKDTIGKKHYTFSEGIDLFAKRLSEKLNIQYNFNTQSVEKIESGFKITDGKEEIYADKVIFAIPGRLIPNICKDLYSYELDFFNSVKYDPDQFIIFRSREQLFKTNHVDYPDIIDPIINAIVQENTTISKKGYFYYKLGFEEPQFDFSLSNTEKYEGSKKLLEKYIDVSKIEFIDVIEWQNTLPVFYPGYIKKLESFMNNKQNSKDSYFFAGDWIGGPYIEGAFTSGLNSVDYFE